MKSVLIVDDNVAIRQVMNLLLTHYGYKVNEAYSYQTFLPMIELEKPDFIFIDVILDNEDGRLICKKLKENDKTKDIHIIIFNGLEGQIEDYEKYKADGLMDKYYDIADLIEVLNYVGNKAQLVYA